MYISYPHHDFHHVFFLRTSFLQAYSVDGNPLKLEDEFRHPRHSAVLAAAKASLVPATPRGAGHAVSAEPEPPRRMEGQPVTHRQGRRGPSGDPDFSIAG